MGSRSSAGKSLELLREESSASEPDNSPSSEEEDPEEEEEELEEESRSTLLLRLVLFVRLDLGSKCLVFLALLRGEAGGERSEGEDKRLPGLGERVLLLLDLDLAAEEVASLTAEVIMAGMLLDTAAFRASWMEARTG